MKRKGEQYDERTTEYAAARKQKLHVLLSLRKYKRQVGAHEVAAAVYARPNLVETFTRKAVPKASWHRERRWESHAGSAALEVYRCIYRVFLFLRRNYQPPSFAMHSGIPREKD